MTPLMWLIQHEARGLVPSADLARVRQERSKPSLIAMSYSSTYTCPNQGHARRNRYFRWLAIGIICVALFASFRIGLVRGLSDSIGQASWGRVLFAVGAAVTEMEHGGYGYTTSNVVETVL